jgi:dolichol-phosphate mannosyltransferase
MEDIKLSVIIPSYLEEENLRIILPRLRDELNKIKDAFEILIIDTKEKMDNTAEVCAKNKAKYINREGGNNYGDAVKTGIQYARGENIIFMDADGSHAPEFIKNLYEYKNNYDVVIASRYVKGGATDNSNALIFMSLVLNLSYSLILGLKCKDVSNSFKLYKGAELKNLNLKCDNFDIVEEILYKLKKSKKDLKIKEVPFLFRKRMFGRTKRNLFLFILTYLITIFKLRFGK